MEVRSMGDLQAGSSPHTPVGATKMVRPLSAKVTARMVGSPIKSPHGRVETFRKLIATNLQPAEMLSYLSSPDNPVRGKNALRKSQIYESDDEEFKQGVGTDRGKAPSSPITFLCSSLSDRLAELEKQENDEGNQEPTRKYSLSSPSRISRLAGSPGLMAKSSPGSTAKQNSNLSEDDAVLVSNPSARRKVIGRCLKAIRMAGEEIREATPDIEALKREAVKASRLGNRRKSSAVYSSPDVDKMIASPSREGGAGIPGTPNEPTSPSPSLTEVKRTLANTPSTEMSSPSMARGSSYLNIATPTGPSAEQDTSYIDKALEPLKEIVSKELERTMRYAIQLEARCAHLEEKLKAGAESMWTMRSSMENSTDVVHQNELECDILRRMLRNRNVTLARLRESYHKEVILVREQIFRKFPPDDDLCKAWDPALLFDDKPVKAMEDDEDHVCEEFQMKMMNENSKLEMKIEDLNRRCTNLLDQIGDQEEEFTALKSFKEIMEFREDPVTGKLKGTKLDFERDLESILGPNKKETMRKALGDTHYGLVQTYLQKICAVGENVSATTVQTDMTYDCNIESRGPQVHEAATRIYIDDLLDAGMSRSDALPGIMRQVEKFDLNIKQIYRYYTCLGVASADKAMTGMTMNQFSTFCKDADIRVKGLSIDGLFSKAIMRRDGKLSNKANYGNMWRWEFIEGIVRIAHERHKGLKLNEAFSKVMMDVISKAKCDEDPEHRPNLMVPAVLDVLKSRHSELRKLFKWFSRKHKSATASASAPDGLDMLEFSMILKESGVIDTNLNMVRAFGCFIHAHQKSVDEELGDRDDDMGFSIDLNYSEFLECMVRCASAKVSKKIPLDRKTEQFLDNSILNRITIGWVKPD